MRSIFLGITLLGLVIASSMAETAARKSSKSGDDDLPPLPPETNWRPSGKKLAASPKPKEIPPPAITPAPTPVPGPPLIPVRTTTAPGMLPNTVLAWDSESKETTIQPGETEGKFTFYFTNISSAKVVITAAAGSCHCTVPKLPTLPWTIAPGEVGEIPVAMDVTAKTGFVIKIVTVSTDKGAKQLTVRTIIPSAPAVAPGPMDRNKNQELAKADRQAVFRGDCASCHVEPTRGKVGKELYEKACGICHDSDHRASMVPDLRALNHDTNADFWKTWITQGKPGSLMPAFAASQGGPLSEAQIDSIVQYLSSTIPKQAVRTAVK